MSVSLDRGIERMSIDSIPKNVPVKRVFQDDKDDIRLSGTAVPSEVRKLFHKIIKGPHPDVDLSKLDITPLLPEEYMGTLDDIESYFSHHLMAGQELLTKEEREILTKGTQVMQFVKGNQKVIHILRGLLLKG